jgi:hypothetical protein
MFKLLNTCELLSLQQKQHTLYCGTALQKGTCPANKSLLLLKVQLHAHIPCHLGHLAYARLPSWQWRCCSPTLPQLLLLLPLLSVPPIALSIHSPACTLLVAVTALQLSRAELQLSCTARMMLCMSCRKQRAASCNCIGAAGLVIWYIEHCLPLVELT